MRKVIHEKIHSSMQNMINLNNLDISSDEIQDIASEIKKICPNIQGIFLNNNQIDDSGAILIAQYFKEIPGLSYIDLQFNSIGLSGAAALFTLKQVHPNLKLALHGNQISDIAELSRIEKTYDEKYHH